MSCIHFVPQSTGGECAIGAHHRPSTGVCRQCAQRVEDPSRPEPVPVPRPSRPAFEEIGRKLWAELHTFALKEWSGAGEDATAFLAAFEQKVPVFGCSCRKHWQELLEKNPPWLISRDAFFAWTVARHNDVNRKLGKPTFSLSEALARWS